MKIKNALLWVLFWMVLALVFNGGIYYYHMLNGSPDLAVQKSLEFFGGYIIELSLSVDNLFLFLVIFASFGIEGKFQRRVLSYGIMGAVIMRLVFIFLGVKIINKFEWVLYVFGVILIFSGIKILFDKEKKEDFKNSKMIKLMGKIIPITPELHGQKFFVRIQKTLYATPLLAILVLVEFSDVLFAIDSIPAIFSITRDPFIVYTSNLFAIMGLRNLYFLLEKVNKMFEYVKYGVAFILIFVGIKLSVLFFHFEFSTGVSVAVIGGILAASMLASVVRGKMVR